MLEGRPIVSDISSESEHVSELLDHYLQPFAMTNFSYIRDSYDFIEKIKDLSIPADALLITGDVRALYTNMHIDLILSSVREVFEEFPDPQRPLRFSSSSFQVGQGACLIAP